jgi:mono/diheme cytochrome c family protein
MKDFLRVWWKRIVLVLVVALVAIQFVPFGVDNPSARDEPKWDSPRTRELFMTSCADCHSNETEVLWFEHVAPIKWYVADHVKEGREALNVSEWHTAAGEGSDEITEVIEKGSMPPDYYTYLGLHGDSKLTAAERQELIDGIKATIEADPPAGGD